ncbi:hypothetical protein C0991_006613 [Blastosporella zonata]|nr:hypothetical protein C0991_006613 [Blastosporella zonata]
MPARGHGTASLFNPSKPRELPRYFTELEFLFAACGVTKNAKKKALGICYVDYNTSEQWLLISEYQPYNASQPALLYSYDDWKRTVISLYPGTNAATKYSMADLDQIMGKDTRTDIKTIGQFADYYRKFYQVEETKKHFADMDHKLETILATLQKLTINID